MQQGDSFSLWGGGGSEAETGLCCGAWPPLHSRRLACRGSAPTLDRGQRGVFVIGQGEAVLALRGMESKEEGGRDKDGEG